MGMFALLLGCGSSNSTTDDGGGDAGSAECGESTCTGQQICIIRQSGPFTADAPDTYECADPPEGCAPSSLCDCEAASGSWEGLPVTGFSLLGERSLYVTDTSCGTLPPCGLAEACMAQGSPFTEVGAASCQPLPEGCAVDRTFCEAGCGESVASAAGRSYAGCAAATWGVGVYVDAE